MPSLPAEVNVEVAVAPKKAPLNTDSAVDDAPPEKVCNAVHELATESEAPPPVADKQTPFKAKQPEEILMPPVVEKVEVPRLKLIPPALPMERIEPGEVVPIPTLPCTR